MHHRTTIAVDLAKSVFEVAVSDTPGRVASRHRLSRGQFERFMLRREPANVVMEACGMAHFWGRCAREAGHHVVLLPPHDVRRYVRGNKTDSADAKALLEAIRNDDLRPVPLKTVDQHALAGLHRMRSAWLATRTARLNTVRGLLRELGFVIPLGARRVVPALRELLATNAVAAPLAGILAEAAKEIESLERRIRSVERALERASQGREEILRLRSVPGVGLLTATALVAFVGDLGRFPSGRHFASYLGLTPRESSSGLKRHLGRISKRGDPYLRMLLIHGARSVLLHAKRSKAQLDPLRTWALGREQARGHNKAAVALANKLARIIWAVERHRVPFEPRTQKEVA